MSDVSNFPGFDFDPFKTDSLIGIDPFIGTAQQTSRMRAFCRITVGGVDVTNELDPHLISVRVSSGSPSPSAEIELDDRDGRLPIPPIGTTATVDLGWANEGMHSVFSGMIMDFEHGFGRKQGGRRMWIHADGANLLGSMKEPIQDHAGEGAPPGEQEGKKSSLSDWIQQTAGHAGANAKVAGFFDAFKQDFWSAANASPMHTISSLSEQFGFMHQWTGGNHLDIEKPGQRGISCRAIWRDNLIGWRVRPFAARPAFSGSKQQSYNNWASNFTEHLQKFDQRLPAAIGSMTGGQGAAATESAAQQDNEGQQGAADSSYMGNGRIIINGEPKAQWNSMVVLSGARPGVDGTYLITVVEHTYSRQGFITTLEVLPFYGAPSGANVLTGFLPKPGPNVG